MMIVVERFSSALSPISVSADSNWRWNQVLVLQELGLAFARQSWKPNQTKRYVYEKDRAWQMNSFPFLSWMNADALITSPT